VLSVMLVCHHSASRCPLPRGPATRCSVTTPHLPRVHGDAHAYVHIITWSSLTVWRGRTRPRSPVPCGVSASLSDGPLGRKVLVCTLPHYRHQQETRRTQQPGTAITAVSRLRRVGRGSGLIWVREYVGPCAFTGPEQATDQALGTRSYTHVRARRCTDVQRRVSVGRSVLPSIRPKDEKTVCAHTRIRGLPG